MPPQHQKRDHADDDRQQRARRRCQPHGQQRRGEVPARQVCARYAHEHHRRDVVHERQLRAADGAEISAEAKVHAGKAAVEDIPAQIRPARRDDGRVMREERDDRFGDELDDDRDEHAEAERDGDGIPQRLQRAAGLARADVLRAERRHRREHGRRHEEQKADDLLHDADGGCVREAAAVGDDGDEQKRVPDIL